MSTTSGLARLYHPSDGALMHSIFALISPWDRSPYALRRVCRSFRAFYAVRVVWTRLLRDHFSAAAAVHEDMTLEEARHLCALALQEPWQELIKGQVLQQFRDSGWSILDLSRTNVTALPHRGHRELEHLTTLRLPLRCSLDSLPEDFAVLQNLTEESFMAAIKRVKTLPEDIVDHPHLRDATELDLKDFQLVSLPERFGELKSLTSLNVRECQSLVSLSEGFGELRNLQTLNLNSCYKLGSLPERFGELKNLQTLNLQHSGDFGSSMSLRSLPEGFGELTSLRKLDLMRCPATLPDTLRAHLEAQGCECQS